MSRTRLSDPDTRRYKLRQTWLIAGSVAAICLWQYAMADRRPPVWISLLIITAVGGVMAATLWKLFWNLADEVVLDGGGLAAIRGERAISIAAADVVDVVSVPFRLRKAVSIVLRGAVAPFGSRIDFLPVGWSAQSAMQTEQFVALLKSRLEEMAQAAH